MNHELARSLFMDYLYDEIEDGDRKRLEHYLEEHPDLRTELDELQSTRKLLQRMPLAEPERQLMVVEPRKRSFSQWLGDAKKLLPQSGLAKFGMAVAASLILLLMVGSAARLHLDVTQSGFTVNMGYRPTVNRGLDADETRELITRIQEQNSALLADYAATIRQENRQQLQQVVRYIEQQRLDDLQLIEHNLDQMYQANSYRWQQTNQFLGEFLQNVNYQDAN